MIRRINLLAGANRLRSPGPSPKGEGRLLRHNACARPLRKSRHARQPYHGACKTPSPDGKHAGTKSGADASQAANPRLSGKAAVAHRRIHYRLCHPPRPADMSSDSAMNGPRTQISSGSVSPTFLGFKAPPSLYLGGDRRRSPLWNPDGKETGTNRLERHFSLDPSAHL